MLLAAQASGRPLLLQLLALLVLLHTTFASAQTQPRERVSLNAGWRFARFTSNPDSLSYNTLKPWMLPATNNFQNGPDYKRPSQSAPGSAVNFVKPNFDDAAWETLDLPHDWAIKGTFDAPGVDGGLGRLPINGVGWYRRSVLFDAGLIASGKSIYLDIDGAMAYAAVWLNGQLVGGWPFGYNSFRLDLTPYAKTGENILAIRLDNALESSRWYPGAGIYRNVWLVTVNPVHVGHFGTYITTRSASKQEAALDLSVDIQNSANSSQHFAIVTQVFEIDSKTDKPLGSAMATFAPSNTTVPGSSKTTIKSAVTIKNPKLWGPPPTQTPNRYLAVTTLSVNGSAVDIYETPFGIRSITYNGNTGISVNGEPVRIYGTCNHHDLGSLGAAFNYRAAERQIEMLQEMGSNALRTTHNPPAPEYLEIADKLGLLVMDEIFDTWNNAKTKNDFHGIFPDWSEPDLRSFVRRDRNHPSIISWSIGNELSEQSSAAGGATAKRLQDIVHEEDPTRLVTVGLNNAGPNTSLASIIDIVGLNYQGEGKGNSWTSSFPGWHTKFPNKVIWSTESASTLSSRGIYLFPITKEKSAIVGGGSGQGGDSTNNHVSSYDLYAPSWAASPDKVFEQQDRHPFVAGEFVWTGWDYIGEPTPYENASRSSYFGIIDLAGFKKDRFYLYQARWRPDLAMAHILPHWTWPGREGQITPVHVYTSGDEAELFVNGKSAGRQKRGQYDYRLRWDSVVYAAGEIKVTTWKNGKEWASASHRTVGAAASLKVTADRANISGDGKDLSFVTVAVVDARGDTVPQASNEITFSITSGSGIIVSTDNGDPRDRTPFPSLNRKAFSGLALAIVKGTAGAKGDIVVEATAQGLTSDTVVLKTS